MLSMREKSMVGLPIVQTGTNVLSQERVSLGEEGEVILSTRLRRNKNSPF